MSSSLSIVFAGTPEFTLPCLNAIHASKHRIRAIYTQPDRPAGRGQKLQPSAVKEWAVQHHLSVHQPLNFKDPAAIAELAALQPDIMVVIAYGLILPQAVLDIPQYGCVNVHASLLPRWRGASPIQHAILRGDSHTGVTIMQMDAGMDTGAMFTQVTCPILPHDHATALHDRLAQLAAEPLLQTLDALAAGKAHPKLQDNDLATYAPKISKQQASINWQQSAQEIDRQIRAFNPWPVAFTHINSLTLRIHEAQIAEPLSSSETPGKILGINKQGMTVATSQGTLLIKRMQFPNAKVLSVADWLNSGKRDLETGMILRECAQSNP